MLENAIEDLHKIIQDLNMKTFVENSEVLPPSDVTSAKTESNKVILVEEQGQKVANADLRSMKSVQRRILSGGGSTGKEEIMDNSFNLGITIIMHCLFLYYLFRSPGLKAQVSFPYHLSSGVCLSDCPSVNFFTFSTSF